MTSHNRKSLRFLMYLVYNCLPIGWIFSFSMYPYGNQHFGTPWCAGEGYTNITLPKVKEVETVKETYSDEELDLLLKCPSADCQFCEYRNWVIVNFLLNSGCPAACYSPLQSAQGRSKDRYTQFFFLLQNSVMLIAANCNYSIIIFLYCIFQVSVPEWYRKI